MEIREDVKIGTNFDFFNLPASITQGSPVLDRIREYIRTKNTALLDELKAAGIVERHLAAHNLVTTRGRNVLARLLAGDVTYSGQINYGALGSSSTAVNNSDTQLGTEVFRKIFASHTTDGNNVAYVDFFYAATDTNGTYNEFGNFIDGTGTANSGQIFSHILTGGWVKTSLQSMFISCQYTLS
jgi:hypothetical protein